MHEAKRNAIRVRGYGLSRDFTSRTVLNPSPGLRLTMQSDLSHKGRGEVAQMDGDHRTTPEVNPALRRGGLISFLRKQCPSRPA